MLIVADMLITYWEPGSRPTISSGRLTAGSLTNIWGVRGDELIEKKSQPALGIMDANSIDVVFLGIKLASILGGSKLKNWSLNQLNSCSVLSTKPKISCEMIFTQINCVLRFTAICEQTYFFRSILEHYLLRKWFTDENLFYLLYAVIR